MKYKLRKEIREWRNIRLYVPFAAISEIRDCRSRRKSRENSRNYRIDHIIIQMTMARPAKHKTSPEPISNRMVHFFPAGKFITWKSWWPFYFVPQIAPRKIPRKSTFLLETIYVPDVIGLLFRFPWQLIKAKACKEFYGWRSRQEIFILGPA